MTEASYVPNGWPRVIPRIVANDVKLLVEFLARVFDARGEYRENHPSEIRIGDSIIMVSEAGPREAVTAFLYVYVADADAIYRRALAAGAQSLEEPADMPYGDRRGMVEDPWGNIWQIATYLGRS